MNKYRVLFKDGGSAKVSAVCISDAEYIARMHHPGRHIDRVYRMGG